MSVINQMLQDLEARRSGLETEAAAAAPVRSAGVVYERRSPKLAIAIGVAVLLTAMIAWFMLKPKTIPAPTPAIVAVAPVVPPVVPPQAIQTPAVTPAAPIEIAKVPSPAAAAHSQPAVAPASKLQPAMEKSDAAALPKPIEKPIAPAKPEGENVALAKVESAALPPVNTQAVAPPPLSKAAQRGRDRAALAALEAEPSNFKNRTPQQRTDERYRDALRKLNEGQTAQARADLIEVLQTQPKHSGARLALVGLELDDKHALQAERLLREGIQLQPQESTFSMALARLEVERGDTAAGLATLNRGLAFAGDDPEYHAFMAALLQRATRHAEAIDHYQVALRQREAANWLVGLAISLEGVNRVREAEQIYRRAQQSNALPADLQDFVAQRLQQLKS